MSGLFANPEFLRNVRAQLRWGRLLAIAAVCAALSLVIGYSFAVSAGEYMPAYQWGMKFFQLMLLFQVTALLIGGGVACIQAVQRERDLNTFDFQRVTRLTPLELAVGKLFGAPVTTYFAVLCLMPAALFGAFVGRARPTIVVAAYFIFLLGCITFHAFALMISMMIERNSAPGAILLFLLLVMFTSAGDAGRLGTLNPYAAAEIAPLTTWHFDGRVQDFSSLFGTPLNPTDRFFGWRVHHVAVLTVVYLIFTAWCLLGLARNLKRDPAVFELFTPTQALGFALCVNLILVGFSPLNKIEPAQFQGGLLGLNLALFFALGLVLLRNRERVRRLLRQSAEAATHWLNISWPAPYLVVGQAIVGLAVILLIHGNRAPGTEWDPRIAAFQVALLTLWLVRDVLFLQWMNLRQGHRQVVLGVLYLVVFYVCTGILFAALDLYEKPGGSAFTAFFSPGVVLGMGIGDWHAVRHLWVGAAAAQVALISFCAALQRRKLREISASAVLPAAAE